MMNRARNKEAAAAMAQPVADAIAELRKIAGRTTYPYSIGVAADMFEREHARSERLRVLLGNARKYLDGLAIAHEIDRELKT